MVPPCSASGYCHPSDHSNTLTFLLAAAYRQALVHQVAAAMQQASANEAVGQENVTPTAGTSTSRQEARLHLVPPTPLSTAPMQAAAVSVAAKSNVLQEHTWSALMPSQGITRTHVLCKAPRKLTYSSLAQYRRKGKTLFVCTRPALAEK